MWVLARLLVRCVLVLVLAGSVTPGPTTNPALVYLPACNHDTLRMKPVSFRQRDIYQTGERERESERERKHNPPSPPTSAITIETTPPPLRQPKLRKLPQHIAIHIVDPCLPECIWSAVLVLHLFQMVLDERCRIHRVDGIRFRQLFKYVSQHHPKSKL